METLVELGSIIIVWELIRSADSQVSSVSTESESEWLPDESCEC